MNIIYIYIKTHHHHSFEKTKGVKATITLTGEPHRLQCQNHPPSFPESSSRMVG